MTVILYIVTVTDHIVTVITHTVTVTRHAVTVTDHSVTVIELTVIRCVQFDWVHCSQLIHVTSMTLLAVAKMSADVQ